MHELIIMTEIKSAITSERGRHLHLSTPRICSQEERNLRGSTKYVSETTKIALGMKRLIFSI